MRIRSSSGSSDVSRPAVRGGKRPDEAAGAEASGQSKDVAVLAGIPAAELTPKVRAALDGLMSEVAHLREELELAKRRMQHLEDLADQDVLVPLANRRAFVRELSRIMAFAERYQSHGSVLYFDINGLKEINDGLGHGAGDAAIRHVADVLIRNVRASDLVGRLGGDEFGVVLANAGESSGLAKAESLAAAIMAQPLTWEGQEIEVKVSCGCYAFFGGETVDDAMAAADNAMYRHKKNGRPSE